MKDSFYPSIWIILSFYQHLFPSDFGHSVYRSTQVKESWAFLTGNFKTLLEGRKKPKWNHQSCVLDYCKGVINYAGFGTCYITHSCLIAGRYDLWEQPRFNYWFLINYLYSPFILCQVMKGSDEQRGLRRGLSDHEMNWGFQKEIKRKERTRDAAPVGGVRLRIHEIGLSFPCRRENT